MAPSFNAVFDQNREFFQMAYQEGEYLFTHAGLAPTWLERYWKEDWRVEEIDGLISDLWRHKPLSFAFAHFGGRSNSYGDHVWQSPIWIRPRSLMKDAVLVKKELIQAVGHTQQNCIDVKCKSTGGRYYFIDTLPISKEYLVIEEGKARSEQLPR